MIPKNKHERRGLIGTVVIHTILLLLFLFLGLTYYEPKPEDGIAVNFGYEEEGFGAEAQSPEETEDIPAEDEPEQQTSQAEEVATQEMEDAPAIETTEEKEERSEEKKDEKTSEKPTEEVKPDPKPSEKLSSALKSSERGDEQGEGDSEGSGDQGREDGDPDAPHSNGNGGGGGSGDYRLGNRQATARPKPEYNCPDEGRVVVKIYVNRQGDVVQAIPGERIPGDVGTTTTSSCLLDRSKRAAMKTKWQGDSDAPSSEIGYIIYNFTKN